jgi:hypothetical protein
MCQAVAFAARIAPGHFYKWGWVMETELTGWTEFNSENSVYSVGLLPLLGEKAFGWDTAVWLAMSKSLEWGLVELVPPEF